jgi:hypothetical protein
LCVRGRVGEQHARADLIASIDGADRRPRRDQRWNALSVFLQQTGDPAGAGRTRVPASQRRSVRWSRRCGRAGAGPSAGGGAPFLSAFEGRRELHRAILRDVLPSDEALSKALDDFVAGLGEADGQRVFIQTHAVVGAIRAAVLARSPHLATLAFEDDLLSLIESDGATQDC